MQAFRDLKVWHKAHRLVIDIYRVTEGFQAAERYGLTSQIRRSASSVPANLAEGCGRGSDADFGRFVQIGLGSASELEYHLLLARDLGFLGAECHESLEPQIVEVKRMLSGLLTKLRAEN